jgi:hypothetical protein
VYFQANYCLAYCLVKACKPTPITYPYKDQTPTMYLIAIAWMYVVLMMSVAEATNATGTVLGAIVTFFLYGLLPLALVVYLMQAPARRKTIKAREAAELQAIEVGKLELLDSFSGTSQAPDASGHAPAAAQDSRVPPV